MSETPTRETVVDRLRANLRAADIPFTDADVDALVEGGMLKLVEALDQIGDVGFHRFPDPLIPVEWSAPAAARGAASRAGPVDEPPKLTPGSGVRTTIAALAPLIARREVSPVELTERALGRIVARDRSLNAFQLVLEQRALGQAREAEREIAAGRHRGPLHGVPVAVKDLLDLAGTATTAGSRLRAGGTARGHATSVELLERAGAVIVGKTRMPEGAFSPGSNNPHYGPTRNPWNLEHDSGGSSSGSAAAVADGMVVAALGTDTGGSIRIPAAFCGIVGLKPTFGRTSLAGGVALAWSLDHLGPLTRSVADAAVMLDALAAHDPRDPRTRNVPPARFARDLAESNGVAGLRIGVPDDIGPARALVTPEAAAAAERGIAALTDAGAHRVPCDLPEMGALRIVGSAILAIEAVVQYTADLRERPEILGAFFRQRLLAAHAYGAGAYARAQQIRAELRRRVAARFEHVDLIALPGMPGPATPLGVPPLTVLTLPFNVLGAPAISVPVELGPQRLPLGLQLVGRPGADLTVLRGAAAVEAGRGPLVSGEAP